MSNYYNLDGIITELKKTIDVDKCLLKKWKEVTFPRKKDGSPFQTMSKNVSGASFRKESYALQSGENELSISTWTNTSGYKTDEIKMYELVRYMKDEKKKAKTENYMPKQTYLEQVYRYDAEDMIDAVNRRIEYLEKQISAHEQQIVKTEKAYNTFRKAFNEALKELSDNCGGQESSNNSTLYYMIKDTVIR